MVKTYQGKVKFYNKVLNFMSVEVKTSEKLVDIILKSGDIQKYNLSMIQPGNKLNLVIDDEKEICIDIKLEGGIIV